MDLQELVHCYPETVLHSLHDILSLCRFPLSIDHPMMYDGQQQNGIRPGTEAVGAIVAMSIAFASANDPSLLKERTVQFRDMTDAIWKALLPFVATGFRGPCPPSR